MVRKKGVGRGWHGDPEGHSRASRGITSLRDFPTPAQALDKGVVSTISQIRRLKRERTEALRIRDLESADLINQQITIRERFLRRVLKTNQLELMEMRQ